MEKSGIEVSALGFGLMRLPLAIEGSYECIDEKLAVAMIHHAIDHGINYLDTAYVYHGENSERVLRKALAGGYRKKVHVATKLPCGKVKSREDMERLLMEQLEKTGLEQIDFYLLHALNRGSWDKMKGLGVLEFLDQAKKDGRIRHAGFSFHDSLTCFKDILDSYDWDMCQIQLNYMDIDWQAGMQGLQYAAHKGIDVVVMEPLRGGDLVDNLPDELLRHFEKSRIRRKPVEWAFRWLYNRPEIKVILSGMSTMGQLEENLEIFKDAKAGSMDEEETRIMDAATKIILDRTKVKCTACKYCMPCPQGVNIPFLFSLYNNYSRFEGKEEARRNYKEWKAREQGRFTADLCIRCGLCEPQCPQSIPIPDILEELDRELSME
ncbi:MAG: aldo/keto reductase [Clostridia bacterium]